MKRKKHICMTPGCKRQAVQRGICKACYVAARRLVTANIVSWDELESLGLILPSRAKQTSPFIVAYKKAVRRKIKANIRKRQPNIKRKKQSGGPPCKNTA